MRSWWHESATCCGAIGFVAVWRRLPGSFSSVSGCALPPNAVEKSDGNRRGSSPVSVYMSVNTSELKRFRAEKDRVFAQDPHSPLTSAQRSAFRGLQYFDENPQLIN